MNLVHGCTVEKHKPSFGCHYNKNDSLYAFLRKKQKKIDENVNNCYVIDHNQRKLWNVRRVPGKSR